MTFYLVVNSSKGSEFYPYDTREDAERALRLFEAEYKYSEEKDKPWFTIVEDDDLPEEDEE
jgi:hypothetical protein